VIGAPFRNGGSVYLFSMDGSFRHKLTMANSTLFDTFGQCVAISENVIVIGSNGFTSGTAFLFSTDGSFLLELAPPDIPFGDFFGYSVAVSGDIVVVGAPQDDEGAIASGSAYVFSTDGSIISFLTAPDGSLGDEFGYSVAVSGDIVMIGAHLDDDNATDSGAVYVFSSDGVFINKLTAPDSSSDAMFGSSLAVSNNLTVIGAVGDNDNIGSAYLFDTDGVFIIKINAPDGLFDESFGISVAISNDYVVIGAHYNDQKGVDAGVAYVFSSDGSFISKSTAPDGTDNLFFGISVAVLGDAVIVGASGDGESGIINSGSVSVFNV